MYIFTQASDLTHYSLYDLKQIFAHLSSHHGCRLSQIFNQVSLATLAYEIQKRQIKGLRHMP